jgi:LssY-like putative type I secretion system component LssY
MNVRQPVRNYCILTFLLAASLYPSRLAGQLVSDPTPPSSSVAAKQNASINQAPSGKLRLSQELQLTADQLWLDTGIDVQAGERLLITAKGKLRYIDAQVDNGPEGNPRGFKDLLRSLPFNDVGRGALIGRIGDAATSQPFLVGARRDMVAPIAGRLSVGINQTKEDSADGTYAVRVEVYAPASGAARVVARQGASMPGIDNSLFAKIPRRITDKAGNPGDMVNFLILGSEPAMQRVFMSAGWVKVDPDVSGAVVRGILDSLSKESYLTMPMSQLCLFGRFQDYGWAHAEPISVVASRNHLRIWRAGFQVNGQTLWAGAATHDIGFERDQRNNSVTHKIDPNIDLERDYVEKTLASTGYVTDITHFLPDNPLKEARTATGGSFNSNGQVLILKLDETGVDPSATKDSSAGSTQSGCPVSPAQTARGNPGIPGSNLAQNSAPFGAPGAVTPSATSAPVSVSAPSGYSGYQGIAAAGGALQILRADYGIDKRFTNVTSRLASHIQGNSLSLRVTNETMGGDPAEDHAKTLNVWYSFNGRIANVTVNEKDTLNLPADGDFHSGNLRVMRAQYGIGNRYADVTDLLNSRIQGDALGVRVTNETMGGDPDPQRRKQLIVFYIFNGRQARVTVNEKENLTLPGNDAWSPGSSGDLLEILQASYGASDRNRDVSKFLASQIRGNSLQVVVSNAAMGGDPAENQKKRLRVTYLWQGLRYQTTVAEGETLLIP